MCSWKREAFNLLLNLIYFSMTYHITPGKFHPEKNKETLHGRMEMKKASKSLLLCKCLPLHRPFERLQAFPGVGRAPDSECSFGRKQNKSYKLICYGYSATAVIFVVWDVRLMVGRWVSRESLHILRKLLKALSIDTVDSFAQMKDMGATWAHRLCLHQLLSDCWGLETSDCSELEDE